MKHTHRSSICTFILLVIGVTLLGQTPPNPHEAPLYWSVYEYHRILEHAGQTSNHMPEEVFMENIQMINEHLKPYGYNIICMDGWGDIKVNENGYRITHSEKWEHDYAWWADTLQKLGMTLGMYHNPLWISEGAAYSGAMIEGTSIPLTSIIDTSENSKWFNWIQIDQPGAKEYITNNVNFYADMGVRYLRVDFLSWYEDGHDRNYGTVGPDRPAADYDSALKWMREACDDNGMLLSLVMPHLYDEAESEQLYGHMIRINGDVFEGGWNRFNNSNRGVRRDVWSQWENPFDGYTYWSYIAGREKLILDGDFIRLNTMSNVLEKQTVISLHLMAGGPLSPTDQAGSSMTAENIAMYTNSEMLALNEDGFVGKPLTNDPTIDSSQIWKGQMSNGDWVVAFFNREETMKTRSMDFAKLGISGKASVRNLWEHTDMGSMTSISANIPPHGCMVFNVSEGDDGLLSQTINFPTIADVENSEDTPHILLNATTDAGLTVEYELIYGPAFVSNDTLHFEKGSGDILVKAMQEGNETYGAAVPVYNLFHVTDPVMPYDGIYLVGSATPAGWNIGSPIALEQSESDPYIFTWTGNLVEGELKFSTFTGDWCEGDWFNATEDNASLSSTTYQIMKGCDGPDYKWVVSASEDGEYKIEIDVENETIAIELQLPYNTIYMLGDATPADWNIGAPVELTQDGSDPFVFRWSGSLTNGELKFPTFTGDWCDGDWLLAPTADQPPGVSGYTIYSGCPPTEVDFKWKLTDASNNDYTVEVNLRAKTVKIESVTNTINPDETIKVISIYSQPAAERIIVETDELPGFIEIFNCLGQFVYSSELSLRKHLIDITNWKAGIYILSFTNGFGLVESHKIVIN
jgi:hypothetical protein